jgi:mannose/fructose/N-acetylgalactosamine-specific phosphotransferase system component IID
VKLSKGAAAEILWRSFFIQGAWNFKGMQNVGFVYSMLPGLKALTGDGLEKAAGRYVRFFNTHPYMAPTIMGVMLNLEEQGDTGTADKLKQALSSALAAIGDSFFWATLKPIIALLFLLTVMFDQAWGIALVLITYNALHVWTMIWGFGHGYRNGPGGALEIGKILSVDRARRISYAIPLLAGMVLVALSGWQGIGKGLPVSIAVFLASLAVYRFKLGVFWLFYGVFTLTLIWTIIR